MNDYSTLTRKEFLELSSDEITDIIKSEGRPKVAMFLPDGNRRYAMSFLNITPKSKNFETKYMKQNSENFKRNIKMMFDHGLKTLFVPCLKHENLYRDKKYVDTITQYTLKLIFADTNWIDFYNENNIKVKIYGDLDYISDKGFDNLIQIAKDLEKITSNNTKHKLFYGLACSNKYEYPRLMDLAIDFYKNNNRNPTYEEKIEMYYGEIVNEVDLFIRPTEIRDSDIQPPLISGNKTQMYFLVAPDKLSFNRDVYRYILYDFLFCRSNVFGSKTYQNEMIAKSDLEKIKDYYLLNKSKVIGLGEKIGQFWIPQINIQMPKKE
jgi:undecaprenyl diphosphate synthase